MMNIHEVSNICILYINTPLGTRISFRKNDPLNAIIRFAILPYMKFKLFSFFFLPSSYEISIGHTRLMHLAKLRNRHIQTLRLVWLPPSQAKLKCAILKWGMRKLEIYGSFQVYARNFKIVHRLLDAILSHLSLRTYFFIYILVMCNTTIPPDLHPWWKGITKQESNKQFPVTYIR